MPINPVPQSSVRRLAVGVEQLLTSLLPCGSEFVGGDVPVGPALSGYGPQILAKLLERWTAKEPVPVVDLVQHQTGFQNDDVRNHRVVQRVRVLGDIGVPLHVPCSVRQERPVSSCTAAVLIRLCNVVGADRDQPAISDFQFTMQLHQPFSLPAVLWAEATSAQNEHHRMRTLQFRQLSMFGRVVRFSNIPQPYRLAFCLRFRH